MIARNNAPEGQQVDRRFDFYGYTVNILNLAAGGNSGSSFSIDTDSDFVMQKLCVIADIAGANLTFATLNIPLVTMQISDGGSSRTLFSEPIAAGNVFGTGMEPFILPAPRVFSAGSTITLAVANYSNATTYNLRFGFIGLKKYRFAAGQ